MEKAKRKKTKIVLLGIGTNKGNRKKNISLALKLLSENPDIKLLKISKMLKNPPQEGIKSGYFLNGAVKLLTSLSPIELFKYCKKIEKKQGRIQSKDKKKKSRTIDLDILFYGNKILKTRELTIPHPLLHKRYFVMIPLMEIAPDFRHPVFEKKVRAIHELSLHSDKHKKLGKCCIEV